MTMQITKSEIIEMLEVEWRDRLKAAVLAEREACAKLADEMTMPDWVNEQIAKAIRARGTHE